MIYVPDASVILKWAFHGAPDEEDQAVAIELLQRWTEGRCTILLPSLWVYEVGNIVGRKHNAGAEALMSLLIEYRFSEAPMTESLCRRALRLMKRFDVTFYDAVYHAVALEHGGTLVTADAAYRRKARTAGRIVLLKELATI